MRRFVYCKVVLATSLMWVLVDVFLLLYFSECNKCDDKKERSLLPALRGECQVWAISRGCRFSIILLIIFLISFSVLPKLFFQFKQTEYQDLKYSVLFRWFRKCRYLSSDLLPYWSLSLVHYFFFSVKAILNVWYIEVKKIIIIW